jgi:hypothetical protein
LLAAVPVLASVAIVSPAGWHWLGAARAPLPVTGRFPGLVANLD